MKIRISLVLVCFLAVVAFGYASNLLTLQNSHADVALGYSNNLPALQNSHADVVTADLLYRSAINENTPAVVVSPPASSTLNTFLLVLPWLISGLSILFSFLKAKKDGKTWAEALHVAVNTLKVEDKMVNGAFKPELVEKVGAVSEALQVSAAAKQKVEQILKEGREVDDIKIASIKGKPIYLGDIAGIGSTLAAAINRIRKIRLKL
ncbi:hypothetical protein MASR1M12_18730 [Erysipelotrichia bacterium]